MTISETHNHMNFRAIVQVTLSTEDEIKLWLKSYTVTWMGGPSNYVTSDTSVDTVIKLYRRATNTTFCRPSSLQFNPLECKNKKLCTCSFVFCRATSPDTVSATIGTSCHHNWVAWRYWNVSEDPKESMDKIMTLKMWHSRVLWNRCEAKRPWTRAVLWTRGAFHRSNKKKKGVKQRSQFGTSTDFLSMLWLQRNMPQFGKPKLKKDCCRIWKQARKCW